MMQIDGSHGEGGGQLVRLAVALAAITGRAIRLENIRARRSKPGSRAQHLAALRAVAALCGGRLEGAELGAEVRIASLRRGYYPRGGGCLVLDVTPNRQLTPLQAEPRGAVREVRGRAHVAHLPLHIPERMAVAARAVLADLAPRAGPLQRIRVVRR